MISDDADPTTQGPLGGESSIMDGGKGKFGMDLQFVSIQGVMYP